MFWLKYTLCQEDRCVDLRGGVYQFQFTCLIQSHDVIAEVGSTCGCHHLHSTHVFADLDADLAHLQSQFSGGHDDQSWGGKKRQNSVSWTDQNGHLKLECSTLSQS